MAAKKTTTDATENTAVAAQGPMSDYEAKILAAIQGWEADSVGFAPYLKVEGVGSCFFGKVCTVDARDPEFVRYIVECEKEPIKCQRGPVDGAEEVWVQPGEFFTVSAYAGLPADRYFDMSVFCKVKEVRKLPPNIGTGGNRKTVSDFYVWDVLLSPENRKIVNARRADELKMLMDRRTLGEGEVIPTRPQLAAQA
jgi:hypothetical protein